MDRKGVLGGSYYPGLPSARVLLIGAGTIGLSALNVFLRNRLEVVLFDKHPDTFFERAARAIPREVLENGRDLLQLEISSEENWRDTKRRLAEHLTTTDILFAAAVRRPTFPKSICEYLVSREMLLAMPDNGVVIDSTACDKDLIETAVSSPKLRFVYQDAGQWHYNCDHVPALVPVTATEQLTQATLPYIKELAALGFEAATEKNLALAGAVVCARGCLTHEYTCAKKGLDYTPLQKLLTDPVA
jgi:alanine dehydrogenase